MLVSQADEKTFLRIVGISIRRFFDPIFAPLRQHKIDIFKWQEYCVKNGYDPESNESLEEFNLRYYKQGKTLNQILEKYF